MQYDIEGYGVDDDKIITKEGMPTLRTNLSDRPVPFLSTILILFYHGVVVVAFGLVRISDTIDLQMISDWSGKISIQYPRSHLTATL